jgi:hypothetical protein
MSTFYPNLTKDYQKIVSQGENFMLTLISDDISICFGAVPNGPGHILNTRMTNGLRFDSGSPFDVHAKIIVGDFGTCALTIWN